MAFEPSGFVVFFLVITYTISRCPYQLCTKEMQILVFPKLFSSLPSPLFIPLLNSALYLEISPWAIHKILLGHSVMKETPTSSSSSFSPLPQSPHPGLNVHFKNNEPYFSSIFFIVGRRKRYFLVWDVKSRVNRRVGMVIKGMSAGKEPCRLIKLEKVHH